jgi:hypothetical protein
MPQSDMQSAPLATAPKANAIGNTQDFSNSEPSQHDQAEKQLAASRARLQTLDCLLGWRLDVLARSRRAQLIFELVDVDAPELDVAVAEMTAFNRICRALVWPDKAERRSA